MMAKKRWSKRTTHKVLERGFRGAPRCWDRGLKFRMKSARRAAERKARLMGNGLKVSDEVVMKGLKIDEADSNSLKERWRKEQYWKDRSAQLDYDLYVSAMNGNALHAQVCREVLGIRIPDPSQQQQQLHEPEAATTAVEPRTSGQVAPRPSSSTSSETPSSSRPSSSDNDPTSRSTPPTPKKTSDETSRQMEGTTANKGIAETNPIDGGL